MSVPAVGWRRAAEEGSPLQIVFQIHHADANEALQQKAARALEKLAARLRGAVDATVRFCADGAMRRVEITVRRPRRRALVAVGTERQAEGALTQALDALESQVAHARSEADRRGRRTGNGEAPLPAAERDGQLPRGGAAPMVLLTVEDEAEGALEA